VVENSGGVAHYQTAAGEMMIEIGRSPMLLGAGSRKNERVETI